MPLEADIRAGVQYVCFVPGTVTSPSTFGRAVLRWNTSVRSAYQN